MKKTIEEQIADQTIITDGYIKAEGALASIVTEDPQGILSAISQAIEAEIEVLARLYTIAEA
jgi:hypothetical protein